MAFHHYLEYWYTSYFIHFILALLNTSGMLQKYSLIVDTT